ncbi:hypothetical protein D1007_16180 [Hordeum vulgare]|nr:hypothetical protein D1007_16180 [Hordeum vulgare]
MMTTRGVSDVSDVDEEYIECLCHHRKVPSDEHVAVHIVGVEYARAPQDGESSLPYPIDEVDQICARLTQMADEKGLTSMDLLATMVACRVQPLQRHPHLIYHMGGSRDPCRLSMKELRLVHMARRVNLISAAQMGEGEWRRGNAPYGWDHPAPMSVAAGAVSPAADLWQAMR